MLWYTVKRILWMPVMLLVATFLIFCLINISPTDPATYMLPTGYTQQQLDKLHHDLGIDQPVPVQYVNWVSKAIQGDFGTSFRTKQPVWKDISYRIPVTVTLALVSTFLIFIIGTPLGILCAVKQYSWFDNITNAVSKILGSFPNFWLSTILLLIFALKLRWLPVFGTNTWQHWVLPVVSLSIPFIASFIRIARSSMLDCIRQDYVRTSRSKGAKEGRVIFRDALRNAMLPLVTMTGMQFAMLMGGTVITENVFAMPGIGAKVVEAIQQKDIPMILACTFLLSIFFMVITLLIDLTYTLIDPRIKASFIAPKRKQNKQIPDIKEVA